MRSIDQRFYKSVTWIRCAEAYKESVNGLCERCVKNGLITPARVVHHKIYMNSETVKDASLAYEWDNLEALCQDCHNREHFGDKAPKRYQIVDGVLVIDTRQR